MPLTREITSKSNSNPMPDRNWPAYREHLPAEVHRVITYRGGELV